MWLVQWKEMECMCLTKGQNISASLSMFPVDSLAKGEYIFFIRVGLIFFFFF